MGAFSLLPEALVSAALWRRQLPCPRAVDSEAALDGANAELLLGALERAPAMAVRPGSGPQVARGDRAVAQHLLQEGLGFALRATRFVGHLDRHQLARRAG